MRQDDDEKRISKCERKESQRETRRAHLGSLLERERLFLIFSRARGKGSTCYMAESFFSFTKRPVESEGESKAVREKGRGKAINGILISENHYKIMATRG